MSGWYGKGKQRLALGDAAWDTSTYMAVVIDTADYTYSRTHQTMENANVPTAAKQGTPVALTGKTVNTDGELDCVDFTITGLNAGQDTAEAVIIYEEAAAADASRYPLLFIDGLTIIPNGGDYTFQVEADTPFLGRL
jgi:hypothetical protein